jgi:hypothetical protein
MSKNLNPEKPEKQMIKVERRKISFGERFEKYYGKFIVKINNAVTEEVTEFTMDDIEIINFSELDPEKISNFEDEISEKGYIPLDIYCAQALYKKMLKDYSFALWFSSFIKAKNIVFLGSILSNKETPNGEYYAFLRYESFCSILPEINCYEDEQCILKGDCAIVFKKSFFNEAGPAENNSESQDYPDYPDYTVADAFFRYTKDDINPKKEPAEMPTLEECQAKTIKLLQERLKQVTRERDDLKIKYEKALLITKPQLSTETIELLCKRVCDLELSVRALKTLDSREIIYLFQLITYTAKDLNRIRYLGKRTIKEIGNFIAGLGLSLGTNFSQEELNSFWKKIEEKIAAK